MVLDTAWPALSKPLTGLLLAGAFLTLMALFFTYHDPYRDVGGSLVEGGNLEESPFDGSTSKGHWRGRGKLVRWEALGGFESSGGIRLGTGEGRGSSLNYSIDSPERFRFLRLSAQMRTEGIVHGEKGWNTARLVLSFSDGEGQRSTYDVCEITGSEDWRLCERVIPVPRYAVAAQVHVQNLAASGTLWVDDVRLVPAVGKASTPFWRALFGVFWGAVLVYCAWMSRLFDQPLGFAIILIALVIIAGVSAPESTIDKIVHRGADTVNGLLLSDSPHVDSATAQGSTESGTPAVPGKKRAAAWPLNPVLTVKKLGHFVLFGLLAFAAFSSTARRRRNGIRQTGQVADFGTTAAALLLFAAAAEVVQFLTTTRNPSVMDWAIDAGGILMGGMAAMALGRFAGRVEAAAGTAG